MIRSRSRARKFESSGESARAHLPALSREVTADFYWHATTTTTTRTTELGESPWDFLR